MAKNSDPDYLTRINKAITGAGKSEQTETDLDLLQKRVDVLEKKIEKLEKQHQLQAVPAIN